MDMYETFSNWKEIALRLAEQLQTISLAASTCQIKHIYYWVNGQCTSATNLLFLRAVFVTEIFND